MLNLTSRRCVHMTPDRYDRFLGLLETIRALADGQTFYVRELYRLLDASDREPLARQAMIGCLRRYRVIVRQSGLPVRYRVERARIEDAERRITAALDQHRSSATNALPLRAAS